MNPRKIHRREFLAGAAAAGAAAGLAACGASAASPSTAPASATAASSASPGASAAASLANPITLHFWHIWSGEARTAELEKVLRQFEVEHPGIKVEGRLTSFDVWLTEQLTAVASGDVPELSLGEPQRVPELVESDALLELTPYLKRDNIDLSQVLFPAERELVQIDGKSWVLPMSPSGAVNIMYYNKTMFTAAGLDPEKPPKTWDELDTAATALTKRDGNRVSQNAITILGSLPILADFKHWMITNQASYLSDDGRHVMFNDANGLETLQWIVDFADKHYGGWANVSAGSDQEEVIFQNLYAGHEAMYVSGPWMFGFIRDNAPDVFANLGVSHRPTNKGDKVGGLFGDNIGAWLLKGNKHPDESWELLKYLTLGKGGCNFMQSQLRPSAVQECTQSAFYTDNNQWWPEVLDVIGHEVATPLSPVKAKVDEVALRELEEALFKRKTPKDALDTAAAEGQKILDDYWKTRGG